MALTVIKPSGLDLSGNFTVTSISATANVSAGNVKTDNLLYANGSPYVFGSGNAAGSNTQVQFNNANSFAGSANFTFNNTTNTLSVTNIIANGSGLTSLTGANVTGEVGYAAVANSVAGANVTGQVGNALIASTVYTNAQPNITSVGTLTDLSVSGNATIGGNLVVSGTTTYINVDTLLVEDPIIELGSGANGAPLTTNDNKDRGTLLHYYTSQTVDAFMGWDNSNAEFAFGSNVTVTNDVVAFNSLGNIRAGYFIGNGSLLTGISATSSNTANSANTANTVVDANQSNITSLGNLTGLTVSNSSGIVNFSNTANVTLGNVSNLHISGGTANYVLSTDGAGNLSWVAQTGGGGGGSVTLSNTTANATFYPVFANSTSGNMSTAYLSGSVLTFNPSTGTLTVQDLNTLSDATLKENPEVITDPFSVLNQLFGMSFYWKDTGRKSYGFLAQMLEKILPELVNVNADGKKTVNYIPIIAFLIEAVKKQQEDIEQLKKR